MEDKTTGKGVNEGSLSVEEMDTTSVLEGAEPWDKAETQLVVGSFVAAAIALVIGLLMVPTSVLH